MKTTIYLVVALLVAFGIFCFFKTQTEAYAEREAEYARFHLACLDAFKKDFGHEAVACSDYSRLDCKCASYEIIGAWEKENTKNDGERKYGEWVEFDLKP